MRKYRSHTYTGQSNIQNPKNSQYLIHTHIHKYTFTHIVQIQYIYILHVNIHTYIYKIYTFIKKTFVWKLRHRQFIKGCV